MHKTAETPLQDLVIPLPRMMLTPPIPVKQINPEGGAAKFFGYAVNLTREGIFIPTLNPKPVGFRAQVCFELSNPLQSIEGTLEVVWSRDFDPKKTDRAAGMGLQFIDLPEELKQRIDSFISS